jgi:hypothetical protein
MKRSLTSSNGCSAAIELAYLLAMRRTTAGTAGTHTPFIIEMPELPARPEAESASGTNRIIGNEIGRRTDRWSSIGGMTAPRSHCAAGSYSFALRTSAAVF